MEWNPFKAWAKAGQIAQAYRSSNCTKQKQIVPDRAAHEVDERVRLQRRERLRRDASPYSGEYDVIQSNHRMADGRQWLPRDEWIASIDNPSIPEFGTWARFEYFDADGVITTRDIRHWSKRGAYIEGFCMDRREGRTFRQDRISNWTCG